MQIGKCKTGKLQELAIKHFLFASTCNEFARSVCSGLFIVTLGFNCLIKKICLSIQYFFTNSV